MDKAITPGTKATFYVCGSYYDHVVTEVLSPKKVVLRQGTVDNAFGPPEVFSLRKNGLWVQVGHSMNGGYARIHCTK